MDSFQGKGDLIIFKGHNKMSVEVFTTQISLLLIVKSHIKRQDIA